LQDKVVANQLKKSRQLGMISLTVTVHGFKGFSLRRATAGQAGFRGSTNKGNVESHQWRETCERMKRTTLNLACRWSGSDKL